MIRKYNNGGVITDGDLTTPVAVDSPRFSFPFENQRDLQLIEQDFVVRAENFSTLPLGTLHDVYSSASLLSESNFQSMSGGITKFTRTFGIIPSTEYIFPTTLNVTFPKYMHTILQWKGEGTDLELETTNIDIRKAITKSVQCEKRVRFVNLASDSDQIVENDSHVNIEDIQDGDLIYERSTKKIWEITEVNLDQGKFVATNSGETKTFTSNNRGSTWNFYKPVFNFNSITIKERFSPYITFEFVEELNSLLTGVKNKVDYCTFASVPSIEEYESMIANKTEILVADTQIEQFIGHIYKVSEIYTEAK